jgi:hypothetical protein
MNFDAHLSDVFNRIKQLVVVDTDNDCGIFENLTEYLPNLIYIRLDLNRTLYERSIQSIRKTSKIKEISRNYYFFFKLTTDDFQCFSIICDDFW